MKRPKKFKTVKQPEGSRSCLAACAAMAVGKGLRYATNRMKPSRGGQYRQWEVIKFLADHRIQYGDSWEDLGHIPETLEYLTHADVYIRNNVALLYCKVETGYHAVFWDGKYARDPAPWKPDTLPISNYLNIIEMVPLFYYRS